MTVWQWLLVLLAGAVCGHLAGQDAKHKIGARTKDVPVQVEVNGKAVQLETVNCRICDYNDGVTTICCGLKRWPTKGVRYDIH